MPTWRISQCLPAEVGSFDLVVLDEASQSDITALPALLRGREVLVVGDGKQVSPTSAFVSEERIRQMQTRLTRRHPYPDQLLPGKSIFDLAQTCYGDARISLVEHFRCVPPLIAFANERFYHGNLLPRRLPPRSQRLEPPLLDVYVPHAKKHGKVNALEAERLVAWLHAALTDDVRLRDATVGIISLGGTEHARKLRALVLATFTDQQIAHHAMCVGDPSSFQGDERDLVLLSLAAVPGDRSSIATVGLDAQRKFNVALSRARDRMVLFRSIGVEHVSNGDDLKLWTLQFFARSRPSLPSARTPLPPLSAAAAAGAACRSSGSGLGAAGIGVPRSLSLEMALVEWLAARGYRATTECALGGAVCIVEDAQQDERLCVCLDGGMGATMAEWRNERHAQTALERAGWRFHRMWRASWLVDRARCEAELLAALAAANVRPAESLDAMAVGSAAVAGSAVAGLSVTQSAEEVGAADALSAPAARPTAGSKRKATSKSPAVAGSAPPAVSSPDEAASAHSAALAGPQMADSNGAGTSGAALRSGVDDEPAAKKPKGKKTAPTEKSAPAVAKSAKAKRKRGGNDGDPDWQFGDD